jgi:hypothetical protein
MYVVDISQLPTLREVRDKVKRDIDSAHGLRANHSLFSTLVYLRLVHIHEFPNVTIQVLKPMSIPPRSAVSNVLALAQSRKHKHLRRANRLTGAGLSQPTFRPQGLARR